MDDRVEKHREIALFFIEKYINFKKQTQDFTPEVINTIVRILIQRVNSQPPTEVSEELRVKVIILLE